jgi:hypothetical protein
VAFKAAEKRSAREQGPHHLDLCKLTSRHSFQDNLINKCKVCKHETYIDVECAQAQRYRQMCTTQPTKVAANNSDLLPKHNQPSERSGGREGLKAAASTWIANMSNTLRQRISKKTHSSGDSSGVAGVSNSKSSSKTIHWCVDSAARRTLLHNVCIEKHKGKKFIRALSRNYRKARGWKWYLSMTTCTRIKLVKVII